MKPFPIPVIALGPGSQPEDEQPLQYVSSPGEMAVFRPPTPRPAADPAIIAAARGLLAELLDRIAEARARHAGVRQSLLGMPPDVIDEVNELLGHGEVSALVASAGTTRIQESAFAGIWRIRMLAADGEPLVDDIEAAPIPQIVRGTLARMPRPAVAREPVGPGVMNAPAVLSELLDVAAGWRAGDAAHIVNLTLLPMTAEDLEYLAARLGGGPVTILSRGYGNCRISSTSVPHVWWVQYFNSTDRLILDTLEVVDVPEAALAADEDIADSIERLREWLTTL